MMARLGVVLCFASGLLAGCAATGAEGAPAYGGFGSPQLFEGLGSHAHRVTTASPDAQRYFDQGLTWLYGFNHDEAVRSFTRAAELDPGCAMAWWGISYAQGPNYNDPAMSPARSAAAWDALQRALAALDDETPVECALVEALTHRYAAVPPDDRTELNAAFVAAMADCWARFPGDSDVGTLYADAMMVCHPWELYTCDGAPARDQTGTVVAVLEQVLALDPGNPGANHLYIHAIEPSDDEFRAIPAADRLSDMVPQVGHLRHMPSHIYVQTGMWDRSIEQNAKAMAADASYRGLSPEQGVQYGYMTHNTHMLAFSAMMIGREREAMRAARRMWADVPPKSLETFAFFFDAWMCSVYDVQKRFGRWDELLAEPAPPPYLPLTTAIWHAHRAVAFAAKHDFANAEREHELLREGIANAPRRPGNDPDETGLEFLEVSDKFVAGEIALQQGRFDDAARLLEEAAELEDGLGYGEPPVWLQPVRHTLGAVYLKSGRPADAERVYREDLAKWRENGWSLFGLARALEAQGRDEEAGEVRARFETAWADADAPLTTTCLCIPVL